MNIAYLASPYTHPDPKVKQTRLNIVNQVAFQLMRQGIFVYSPLTHNTPIDHLGIHGNWMTWKDFDHEMLSRCDRLIVLKLSGWDQSKGVAAEIAQAKELGLSIEWMEYSEEDSQINGHDHSSIEGLAQRLSAFYAERDWNQFHSPKNLVMNLGVEVGELMEHFRWLTEAQSFIESPEYLKKVREEIGDVFSVLVHLSHKLGIDPIQAAHEKLTKTAANYPVEKCKGRCEKYTEY